jgi:hypothetical protein
MALSGAEPICARGTADERPARGPSGHHGWRRSAVAPMTPPFGQTEPSLDGYHRLATTNAMPTCVALLATSARRSRRGPGHVLALEQQQGHERCDDVVLSSTVPRRRCTSGTVGRERAVLQTADWRAPCRCDHDEDGPLHPLPLRRAQVGSLLPLRRSEQDACAFQHRLQVLDGGRFVRRSLVFNRPAPENA